MATAAKRRTNLTIVRKAPTVPKRRFEQLRASNLMRAKRTREIATKRVGTLVGAGAAALAGYLERTGKVAPKYTSPMALAVAGGVLSFVLPETSFGRGKFGQAAAEAGAGALAVSAYKLGLGQPVIGEDDGVSGDDSVEGEWSEG